MCFSNQSDWINEFWDKLNQEENTEIKQSAEIYVNKMWGLLIGGKEKKSSWKESKEKEENLKEHKIQRYNHLIWINYGIIDYFVMIMIQKRLELNTISLLIWYNR